MSRQAQIVSQETSWFGRISSRKKKEKVLQLSWTVLPWHGQMRLCAEPQETRSAHALHHGTAEALAGLVCQGCQKAGQKLRPDRQRGRGSQHICQRQDQRNNQKAQPQHARNEQL
eukprot:15201490-Ditylum_brightwellii.AAC.1